VEGQIGHVLKGTNGFGYDPLFLPDLAPGHTMAELSGVEKDAISHRGRALSDLSAQIEALDA
jgi:XTP/dITP diphosphohydrolase